MKIVFILLLVLMSCSATKSLRKDLREIQYVSIGGQKQAVLIKNLSDISPVLVFIHGGPGNPLIPYAHYIDKFFQDKYNLVHWDQRGAGLSLAETDDRTLEIDRYQSDLKELLKILRNIYPSNKVIVVGASWGSLIGLSVAHRNPELVDLYVGVGQMIQPLSALKIAYSNLIESFPNNEGLKKIGAPPWDTMNFFKFVRIASKNEIYSNKISHNETNEIAKNSPYYKTSQVTLIEDGQLRSFSKLINDIYVFNAAESISKLTVPSLFIQGSFDWITPTALVQNFAKIRGGELKELKGYGHNLLIENPKKIEQIISEKIAHRK